MTDDELRGLSMGAVSEAELRQLIGAGETVAERKSKVPSEGLGPMFASFANSGGGWILLGVDDDGQACGFRAPGRVEPQEWLRSKLRGALDPMPPFRCREFKLDGQDVLLIRVGRSEETPYVVAATGAILVREPGGKAPITSQAKLLELCVRPEEGERRAVHRMTHLALVTAAVARRPVGELPPGQTRVSDWNIVASPLSIPNDFREHCLRREMIRAQRSVVLARAAELGSSEQAVVKVYPQATGATFEGQNLATSNEVALCLDAGGVVVGYARHALGQGSWHVGQTADEVMTPLLAIVLGALEAAGASGKTLVHMYVRVAAAISGVEPILPLYTAQSTGALVAPPAQPRFFGGSISLPASDAHISALSERLMREIARAAGIDWWE